MCDHLTDRFPRPVSALPNNRLFLFREPPQHIIRQIHLRRLFSDTDLDSCKLLCAKLRNDILDAIVSTGTALRTDAKLADIQTDIIIDDDQI